MQKISTKSLYSLRSARYFSSKKFAFNDPNHTRVALIGVGFSGLQVTSHLPRLTTLGKYHLRAFDRQTFVNYTPLYDTVPFGLKVQDEIQHPVLKIINDTTPIDFNGVESITPEKNKFRTLDNREYSYDYLVLAPGLNPNLNKVKGLKEALEDRSVPVVSTIDYENGIKAKSEFELF
jgi:sulfide:quinone oxidoreductase